MWLRVSGLLLRYLYLYRHSPTRVGEIVFWPVMDLLVWGFVTAYLRRLVLPDAVVFFLGSLILWDVLYRAQLAITLSLTEEVWVKNLLNLFIAPIRVAELLLATCLMGVLRAALNALVLGSLAYTLYAFNLLRLGPALLPFLLSLLLFGWAVGMCTMALVLRFGQAAEALVWGVPFLLQPVSAVFYPLDVLPPWLQAVAVLLPSTHVFEGMRAVLRTGTLEVSTLAVAFTLNLAYLGLGAAFFGYMLHQAREKGYLTRLGLH
ncbi:MAG: ABC transporter [Candidatus Tectimicrobiota bacterium]|nr:MAG: ABC transporter [Candidatus Tectomicrobia bacterium]